MTVSPREAFKLGFLHRCAEEGLSPEQVEHRVKTAAVPEILQSMFANAPAFAKEHPNISAGAAIGGMIGLPVLAGWGAGHLARKLQGDTLDADDVKKQEIINEMNTLAERSHMSQSKALGL